MIQIFYMFYISECPDHHLTLCSLLDSEDQGLSLDLFLPVKAGLGPTVVLEVYFKLTPQVVSVVVSLN